MRRSSRAIRAARDLLRREGIGSPSVPVEEIAGRHARVVHENLPPEISGMLVPVRANDSDPGWIIVVNNEHASVRQRFTIAHELGHLLLHRYSQPHADTGFKVRFRDENSSTGSIREEIEANQFAAELLMPESWLLSRFVSMNFDYDLEEMDEEQREELKKLAREFGVSTQSLAFRLANLAQY
jgi:hypothetical protein